MAKIIDISDKLSFEEKPKIRIKGGEYEVNNDAASILKVLPKLSGDVKPEALREAYETLFQKGERDRIDALKLNFKDFATVITEAFSAAAGADDELSGEGATPATT